MHLDQMPLQSAIRLMLEEESRVPVKLLAIRRQLGRAVRLIVKAFERGGRLFYVGAGTSGRLGVLDASECPPTFRTSRQMVQGIVAGGSRALRQSVEGAEDDGAAGADAIKSHVVKPADVIIGISASGTAPFVWGALDEGRRRRATTILLCFNPHLRVPASVRPTLLLAADLGPEVLTGSTRLKAGTATKLVLNLFSTLAMVQLGKVRSNLMIDLNPNNRKLRQRAVRIVQELTGATEDLAKSALERSRWVVKRAVTRTIFAKPRR
jgi:N-acetylmuramic acid 6-phosphate etherase